MDEREGDNEVRRARLTRPRVEKATCRAPKTQDFVWDTEATGFALRVTAGGKKTYIFQGRHAGKVLRVTIGDIDTWAVDDARKEARRLQAMIDQGGDPRVAKAETVAADAAKRAKAAVEKAAAIEAWGEYLKARAGKWSARTLLDHQRLSNAGGKAKTRGRKKGEGDTTLPGPLYGLLQLPLAKIDRTAVTEWLQQEQHRPTVARGAFVRLRAFLNWCSDHPAYKTQIHPDACSTRVMRAELPKAQAKDDCLQREQLRPWFDAVAALPNGVHSAYLQCLLLTGARRNELTGLQWADVDFQWNSLTIRDKVEGERVIPLTPYVKSLLLGIKPATVTPVHGAAVTGPSPWVFASERSKQGHITEPRISHNKALTVAGLPPLSLHGLRRSFATLSEWVECPAGIVAQIMGHKPSAIAEKHYRRRPLDLLRKWHTTIEGWMLSEAGIEQPQEKAAGKGRAAA